MVLEHDVVPICPNGLFNFPEGSVQVFDADEEIMELYMTLASITSTSEDAGTSTGGLGYLNATQSILKLELELLPPIPDEVDVVVKAKGRSRKTGTGKSAEKEGKTVMVQLQQDLHMLKASKGDTGSVLWRSSLHLARHILTQHAFPSSFPIPLLNPSKLASSRVLELGSGTGLLGVLLSPLCAKYFASDRYENLKLIQRNVDLNGLGKGVKGGESRKSLQVSSAGSGNELEVLEVDWMDVSAARRKGGKVEDTAGRDGEEGYDLILAVDCIFNESLVQPLVDTLAKYCQGGGRTVVWVVIELRSSDVLTQFMETWLNDPSGPWTIIRLSEDAMGRWDGGAKGRWVGWIGWR